MTGQDKRGTARRPLIARAEIIEEGSSVAITVRVSDVSKDGCYIDIRSPLPKGTLVWIKVVNASEAFEARRRWPTRIRI